MRDLPPTTLQQHLQTSDPAPLLLDVREPHEYRYVHIEGSQLLPMNQVPSKLNELDPGQEIVVICHHGMRSLQVAHYLEQQGFKNVINLKGGIDAWALEVAPEMKRY